MSIIFELSCRFKKQYRRRPAVLVAAQVTGICSEQRVVFVELSELLDLLPVGFTFIVAGYLSYCPPDSIQTGGLFELLLVREACEPLV